MPLRQYALEVIDGARCHERLRFRAPPKLQGKVKIQTNGRQSLRSQTIQDFSSVAPPLGVGAGLLAVGVLSLEWQAVRQMADSTARANARFIRRPPW
jgi:hypothetical protein